MNKKPKEIKSIQKQSYNEGELLGFENAKKMYGEENGWIRNDARLAFAHDLVEILETKLKNDPDNPVLIAGIQYALTVIKNKAKEKK